MASGDSSGGLYGEQGSGSTQILSISGGGVTMRLISGLTASTNYYIEVAAMNNMGTGPYSNIIFQLTEGICELFMYFSLLHAKIFVSDAYRYLNFS